jgi:hypothetical protein
MANIINGDNGVVSGTAGLKSSSDGTGILALQTNGTTAVTVDASQNVGIGTASPSSMVGTGMQVGASSIVESVVSSQTLIGGNAYYSGSAWKAVRTQTGYAAMRLNAVGPGVTSFHQNVASYTAGDTLTNMDTTDVRMYIDASGVLAFNSGYGSAAAAYGCRAWVNFNGTGTVAIRGSGNVSSITDNGTGDYTVNFTTAMPDENYSVVGMSMRNSANASNLSVLGSATYNTITTTSARVNNRDDGNNVIDGLAICVSIFR